MTLFILSECARKISSYSQSVYTKKIVKHCNLHNSTSGIVQCSSVTVIYNSRSVHVQVKFHQSLLSLNILNLGRFVSHCYLRFLHMGRFLMDLPSLLISIFANRDCRNEIHKDFPFWLFGWVIFSLIIFNRCFRLRMVVMIGFNGGRWEPEEKNKSSSSSFDERLVFCNKLVMAAADLVATIHSTLRSCKVAKDKLL